MWGFVIDQVSRGSSEESVKVEVNSQCQVSVSWRDESTPLGHSSFLLNSCTWCVRRDLSPRSTVGGGSPSEAGSLARSLARPHGTAAMFRPWRTA